MFPSPRPKTAIKGSCQMGHVNMLIKVSPVRLRKIVFFNFSDIKVNAKNVDVKISLRKLMFCGNLTEL